MYGSNDGHAGQIEDNDRSSQVAVKLLKGEVVLQRFISQSET